MILYLFDIQPIMFFSTIQLFRLDPPLGKMAADKEFPMPADGIRCGFAAVFCNKRTCPYYLADEEIGESNTFNSNFIAIFAQKWNGHER